MLRIAMFGFIKNIFQKPSGGAAPETLAVPAPEIPIPMTSTRSALGIQRIGAPALKTASVKQLLMIFLPAIAILAAVAVVVVFYQVPMRSLTRDMAAIADIHPFSGILSNLGILLWCVASSTCALAAMILRSVESRRNYLFLLFSALLSAYLMFDDLFLFHEDLADRYLGLDEDVIYALLGISAFTYLVSFRKIILQTNVILFLLALAFLSLSVVVDAIIAPWLKGLGHWKDFIEDGAKWLGIVFWCSYYVETSFQFVARTTKTPIQESPTDAEKRLG